VTPGRVLCSEFHSSLGCFPATSEHRNALMTCVELERRETRLYYEGDHERKVVATYLSLTAVLSSISVDVDKKLMTTNNVCVC
jgi:hypothetical protein